MTLINTSVGELILCGNRVQKLREPNYAMNTIWFLLWLVIKRYYLMDLLQEDAMRAL